MWLCQPPSQQHLEWSCLWCGFLQFHLLQSFTTTQSPGCNICNRPCSGNDMAAFNCVWINFRGVGEILPYRYNLCPGMMFSNEDKPCLAFPLQQHFCCCCCNCFCCWKNVNPFRKHVIYHQMYYFLTSHGDSLMHSTIKLSNGASGVG